MTKTELQDLNDRLGAVHYWLPTYAPTKHFNPKQTILDAVRELTLAHLRETASLALIAQMETRGIKLQEQINRLEELLNGKPATEPTIAAGSIMRGVEQLPEG